MIPEHTESCVISILSIAKKKERLVTIPRLQSKGMNHNFKPVF